MAAGAACSGIQGLVMWWLMVWIRREACGRLGGTAEGGCPQGMMAGNRVDCCECAGEGVRCFG